MELINFQKQSSLYLSIYNDASLSNPNNPVWNYKRTATIGNKTCVKFKINTMIKRGIYCDQTKSDAF